MSAFQVQVGTLLMGQGTPYVVTPPIDGLDGPPIRTSSFNYSGQDGGNAPEQFYGMRQVSIPGTIVSSDCDAHENDRKALRNALPIRSTVTLLITTFAGNVYRVTGKVIQFNMPTKDSHISDFKLELLCEDPIIYNEGDHHEVAITKKVSGGYLTPYVLPVSWQASSLPTNVINNGEATIYPLITITGTGTNPILTNRLTGEIIEIDVTLSAADVLVIDMAKRIATLNGGSVIGFKTAASTWWGLPPESTSPIDLDSLYGTDVLTANLSWDSGQMGL